MVLTNILNVFSCSLAEALDMQPPVMPEDGHTTRVTTGTDLPPGKESSAVQLIWDDDDTKAFYESLPDLRFFLRLLMIFYFSVHTTKLLVIL
jgi:regulator of nonsense transcripts 2